jgi:hypothetical protein
MDTLTGAGYSLDPNAVDMLNAYVPYPNNGVDGYVAAPSIPTNYRQEAIRVDQNINVKTTLFVRFTQDSWNQRLTPALWSGDTYDSVVSPWQVPAKNMVLRLTSTFKPNLMNEVILACMNSDHNTLVPRVGFAYDPTGNGKTAIRGGLGMYHDLAAGIDVGVNEIEGGPPAVLSPVAANIVGYQNIVPGPLAPASMGAVPTNMRIPYVMQYNVTLQHEFKGGNFLSVAWVGSNARRLNTGRNINLPAMNSGTVNVPALAGANGCDSSGNCNVQNDIINELQPTFFFAPYQDYGNITYYEFSATSEYNSLQANLRHAVGHGLTFQAAYTDSHAIDENSAGGEPLTGGGVDDYDLPRWRGTGNFNLTNVLVMNYVYDLPFFKHSSASFVRNGLGGWEFSGITSFYSGEPVDFNCGENGMQNGIGQGLRCNTVGALKIQKGTVNDPTFGPVPTWFNPGAIAQPLLSQYYANGESGMFGYMGRNILTGPGRNNWDLALLKSFEAPWFNGEHSSFQFRLETFNTFNHPQWKSINASCSGATPFGGTCNDANNIGNGEVNGAWAPRLVQLGLKLIF